MMPAGTYYIGDLCYVMHDDWAEFCEITLDGHNVKDGEFALRDGRRFATYTTSYGDGVYPASNGADLGVDAGLIGCIAVNDITEEDQVNLGLGIVVTFNEEFSTSEQGGRIYFGHIMVDTDPVCDDEDYIEDYSYESETCDY